MFELIAPIRVSTRPSRSNATCHSCTNGAVVFEPIGLIPKIGFKLMSYWICIVWTKLFVYRRRDHIWTDYTHRSRHHHLRTFIFYLIELVKKNIDFFAKWILQIVYLQTFRVFLENATNFVCVHENLSGEIFLNYHGMSIWIGSSKHFYFFL